MRNYKKYYTLAIYPFLVLCASFLHTVNVLILKPYSFNSAKNIFFSGFFGLNCFATKNNEIIYSNLTLTLLCFYVILNFIYNLKNKRYNIFFKKLAYYLFFYNSLFLIILPFSFKNHFFGKLILYFPYIKELSRLSFGLGLNQYSILVIITLSLFALILYDFFINKKKINFKRIIFLILSFILYVQLFNLIISKIIYFLIKQ